MHVEQGIPDSTPDPKGTQDACAAEQSLRGGESPNDRPEMRAQ